jgi:cation diffusion facilitator family transporter
MHTESIERWVHDHVFGQDTPKAGERRTLAVIAVTAVTMVIEIAGGVVFGSMALLADGLHMGSHASALAVSAFAYFYTRRHAADPRFNFGTGKVNSLAAFASAVMLVLFALGMAAESAKRLVSPVAIQFDWAILVAVAGFLVNGVCLLILRGRGHDHPHDHDARRPGDDHPHDHSHDIRHDQNLWSAYLHVLADALTSVFAVFALLAGKYLHHPWLDPLMGIVGAVLVACWSWGLLRSSAHVLLDMQAPDSLRDAVRHAVEADGDNRVADLHAWAVGPGIHAAEVVVVASEPGPPDHYREKLADELGLVHVTVEVHRCPSAPQPPAGSPASP